MKHLTLFALAALSLFPCAGTATADLTKSPHGFFLIDGDSWSNPLVDGLRVQIKWTDIQPASATEYDWSAIDQQVANAQTYQKQLGIALVILSDPPAWLTAMPGVQTYQVPTKNGQTVPMVLLWDPIVQENVVNFVTQLCLRYDGAVDYIVMGGMGLNTETSMPDPDEIGLDMTLPDAVAAWQAAANNILDAYATHLYSTPGVIAAGVPFTGPDAPAALSDVIDRAIDLYGQRVGVMDNHLSAAGTTGSLPDALIAQYSSTNPVGFQLLCPVAGDDNGQTLGGTLTDALAAGTDLHAQWIEIYNADADNSDNATTFSNAKANLALLEAPPSPDNSPNPPPGKVKAPHGLYEIGGDAWTNPGISGWKGELLWALSNTADGVYNWSKIDGLVTNATKYHKQLGVSLKVLSQAPAWVKALPGVKTYKTKFGPDPMVLPWDPIVQPKLIAYLKAFCLHFDGKLDYVVIGGLGYKTETYMPLPADIGLNMTIPDYIAAWVNSSNLFIDTYNQNLKTTPFVVAGGLPFDDPGATAAITSVITHGLLYPNFGITQWGLNANSNNGYVINKFIQDNDAGRATGFQLAGASDGSVGRDLQGTLDQALAAGAALGADWIEMYAADAMNPKYAALLLLYNGLLK